MKKKIKIFLDGASIKDIKKYKKQKYIRGFTTNPSLMKNSGVKNCKQFVKEFLKVCPNLPISLEVFADDPKEMIKQAIEINSWSKNIYVKIPIINTKNISMIPVVKYLNNRKIPLNITAVFNLKQVKSIKRIYDGKTPIIISIFAGRISDTLRSPSNLVKKCVTIFKKFKKAETLWASTREIYNLVEAENVDCDIITISPSILSKYKLKNYSINKLNLDTVKMFRSDALKANLKLS